MDSVNPVCIFSPWITIPLYFPHLVTVESDSSKVTTAPTCSTQWIHFGSYLCGLSQHLICSSLLSLDLLPLISPVRLPGQHGSGWLMSVLMVNFMSAWLGHEVPTYLIKWFFWMYLWRCFLGRSTLEQIVKVKHGALPNVCGLLSILEDLNKMKCLLREPFVCVLEHSWDSGLLELTLLALLGLRHLDSGGVYTADCLVPPRCLLQSLDFSFLAVLVVNTVNLSLLFL